MINYSKIFDELFPLNRSIMGEGYRQSLQILRKFVNFKIHRYKSNLKVFDWKVPKEWKIKKAYIKYKGKTIIDFKNNNLHVISYSHPIKKKLSYKELNKNLFSLPNNPSAIPYMTSYYQKNWGFCLSHSKRLSLNKKGNYECLIDSSFKNGYLENGFTRLQGKSSKINLISSYLCHPSMANNELSGPLTLIGVFKNLQKWKNRNYTYEFLINPETIGSLCHIKSYGNHLVKKMNSGLVLTCLGGKEKKLSYKLSKLENSKSDKLMKYLNSKSKIKLRKFDPARGSDERQYNSPGLNLPVGNIVRTEYGKFKEYHSSADNKNFMKIESIKKSVKQITEILYLNDHLINFKRNLPYGELMLGKRDLYPNVNFQLYRKKSSDNIIDERKQLNLLLNILSYADGKKDLLDIAIIQNLNLDELIPVFQKCLKLKLIKVL